MTFKGRSFYDITLFANLFFPILCGRFAFKPLVYVSRFDGFT
ncbi:hypothetical protein LEP1GSC166_3046 [Leptospira kirschneri]|nr:hypothetical protein LEP1GSC166_3046 [Leptospira kirschneri]